MTYDELVRHFGSAAQVARALGVTPAAVSAWQEDGVPDARQWQAELATDGALKADRPANHSDGQVALPLPALLERRGKRA